MGCKRHLVAGLAILCLKVLPKFILNHNFIATRLRKLEAAHHQLCSRCFSSPLNLKLGSKLNSDFEILPQPHL